ncbi:MAG TPA: hypothetical protein VFV99_13180 [Kofleriaceae bacterium]|nr:hypothetical protein [Kofleriaceae bacterium]
MKLVAIIVFALLASPAFAGNEPWSTGVSDQQKQAAQKLLEQGNALFLEKNFSAALEKYKEAVAAWDHPAIRFNMVRCLIQLERPVEASDNLQLALEYGAAPLDEAVYNEALNYQKLLGKQLGDLEVSCTQAGVKVSFDGQPLVTCPGTTKRRATAGQHMIVGTKDGFLTKTVEAVVLGGKQQRVEVALIPLETAAKITHRWPGWVPWSVFGGGLAIAGVGGLLQLQAASRMDSYDKQVTRNCSDIHCDPNDPTMLDTSDKQSAERLSVIAISVMSVGAAAAITGGVMLYMNRGRTVYEKSVEKAARIDVVPTKGGGLVTVGGSF